MIIFDEKTWCAFCEEKYAKFELMKMKLFYLGNDVFIN